MNKEERLIVLTTSLAHGFIHAYGLILPALLLMLAREFGVGTTQMGIAATVYGFAFGLGAVPAGVVSDRFGSRRVIVVSLGGASASSALIGFAGSYWVFVGGLFALGAFSSLYHPSALSLISRGVRRSGTGMGYHGMGGTLFQALTPIAAAAVAAALSWRAAFVIFAFPGMLLAFLLYRVRISEDRRDGDETKKGADVRTKPMGRPTNRLVLFVICGAALLSGAIFNGSVNSFLTAFLILRLKLEILGFTPEIIGSAATTIALLVGVLAQYVGGRVADLRHPEFVMAAAMGLCGFAGLIMAMVTGWALVVFTFIFVFGYFSSQPAQNGIITTYVDISRRGRVFGYQFFIAFGAGSFSSSAAGYVAEKFSIDRIFIMLGTFGITAMCLLLLLGWTSRRAACLR
ncbi:MAG: MFS transporter [Desulfatiglandaceae bacterium]